MTKKRAILPVCACAVAVLLIVVLMNMGILGKKNVMVMPGGFYDPDGGNGGNVGIDPGGVPGSAGLPGMPEGYVLTEEQIEGKRAITEDGVLAAFLGMRPGVDYVEGEFVYEAGDEAEARAIAAAYGGELIEYSDGMATAKPGRGSPFSLGDLLAASADMSNNLPPIGLNMLYHTTGF